jgi:hypothetical protein
VFDNLSSPIQTTASQMDPIVQDYVQTALDEDIDHAVSPLEMPSGQIDGLLSLEADSFLNSRGQSPHRKESDASSMLHLSIPRFPSAADLAISALQYLPYPLLVLSSLKTLVLANEAMARLLGLDDHDDDASVEWLSTTDKLRGQTLSQLGIDMLQEGRPVWVAWDSFLDSLAEEGLKTDETHQEFTVGRGEGDVTPTGERTQSLSRRASNTKSPTVHDAVVEVVIAPEKVSSESLSSSNKKSSTSRHTFAKMIVTAWEIDDERFFTMTFTSTDSSQSSLPSSKGQSRHVNRAPKHRPLGSGGSGIHSSPSSISSGQSSNTGGSSNSSAITSPTSASMSMSPFPPLGPPTKNATSSAPSSLQKLMMMKDSLLDTTEIPILAMWKDESLTVPNRAARRLFHPTADLTQVRDGFDLVTKWHIWNEDFTERLDPADYPISVLIRTQTPFSSRKIGIYDPDSGRKIFFDCLGEAIRDPETNEFLAGIVTCRDITEMTDQINEIKEKDDQRFQLICDSMPQMIWTTSPDGRHDWFSQRW